jgi:hypothetical protein
MSILIIFLPWVALRAAIHFVEVAASIDLSAEQFIRMSQ